MKSFALVMVALFLASGCTSTPPSKLSSSGNAAAVVVPADALRVHLMTYNVENLFDSVHDQGKDYYAFLPLGKKQTRAHKKFCDEIKVASWRDECLNKDWSETNLKAKMQRLAATIHQVNNGSGPDLLFVAEVENKSVLDRLNKDYLNGKYEVILIEGNDKRGIDVGMLSKLPLVKPAKLHAIPFVFDDPKRAADTRGILEATFKLPNGDELVAYSLHLPNPAHPSVLRTQSLQFLNQLKAEHAGKVVVAAGDFNITSKENAAEKRTEFLSENWLVSHAVGCKGCVGTYYYKPEDNWSFLDWMIFSKNLSPTPMPGWKLDASSVNVLTGYGPQINDQGRPMSFESSSESKGVSDHLPLGATLYLLK